MQSARAMILLLHLGLIETIVLGRELLSHVYHFQLTCLRSPARSPLGSHRRSAKAGIHLRRLAEGLGPDLPGNATASLRALPGFRLRQYLPEENLPFIAARRAGQYGFRRQFGQ